MFFKKKQDKIRRCPEGHILDPSWTHCPYCQDPAEPAAPPAPSYGAGPGFAPPPAHGTPSAHGQPPVYAPPPLYPPAAPTARPAGGLDDNLDKTVVNPRVPAAPPPPPPPLPSLLETAQAFNEDGEEDPDVTRVQRPAAAAPPAPAAAPPPVTAPPRVSGPPPSSAPPPPAIPAAAPPPPVAPLREPAAMPSPGSEELTQVLPRASGPKSLVAWLVVVDGDYRGRDFRLSGPRLRVGIAPDCELSLPEESYLSRHHAELELVDGDYVLRDLASRNGSYVNGERVDSRVLRDGDAVRFGLTHMIYRTLLI
jgi:hypothetical protein